MTLPDLPARDPDSGLVNVVIDAPRGSANKFKYDERLGIFRMSRMLPPGMISARFRERVATTVIRSMCWCSSMRRPSSAVW
jgi:hypothetical protein